jgi:hypothetical protein
MYKKMTPKSNVILAGNPQVTCSDKVSEYRPLVEEFAGDGFQVLKAAFKFSPARQMPNTVSPSTALLWIGSRFLFK